MRRLLFFLLPATYVLQNPTHLPYEEIQSGLKIYHISAILLIIFTIWKSTKKARNYSGFYFAASLISCIAVLKLDARILNMIIFLLVLMAASSAQYKEIVAAKIGMLFGVLAIVLSMIVQLPVIIESSKINIEGRPYYPTLLAGGINIEVSTLAVMLSCIVFKYKKYFYGIIIGLFYVTQTRTIFLSIVGDYIVGVIKNKGSKNVYQRKEKILTINNTITVLLMFGAIAILIANTDLNLDLYMQRILGSIGEDPGSQGRLFLYATAFNSADCFIIGCGIGSAAEIIRNNNVYDFFEDNFHNVYLQQLIEVGIASLVMYIIIIYSAIKNSLVGLVDYGLASAILTIFLMGFLQFNGYEILTAFILGLGLSNGKQKTKHNNLC